MFLGGQYLVAVLILGAIAVTITVVFIALFPSTRTLLKFACVRKAIFNVQQRLGLVLLS